MKIYTRTGDSGQTSLVGGKRVSKTHPRLEAYGTVDELSSHLGLLASLLTDHHHRQTILTIQQTLFSLSAILATEPESKWQPEPLSPSHTEKLEAEIDHLQQQLPALHAFIIPGGSQAACQAHVCRTVSRRAERRILALTKEIEVSADVLRYVNRLSDYLFVLARHLNVSKGIQEITH
ncbi:MAG: cob(I)yrinic acid a,c-diamide adenosyltransferase [Bacteroidaceae bacterium]|nr:cob(I)yrinic acid a,c-diamide adenosyltransferase [Bacteroidaceae bacterium]